MQAPSDRRIARFGVVDLDPRTGELRKRGVRIHLQEQPFQVLALLVERAGDLVTREELRQRLWSDSVFVDFDQGLNKAVLKIRQALGDSAENPRFVETLERRGYRFIASVEWVDAGGPPGAAHSTPAPPVLARLVTPGRTYALGQGTHEIGRDPAAEVWIDSSVVSRRHAAVRVNGRVVTIEDLGSRNGTFVNEVRVLGEAVLADGDRVRLGTILASVLISSGKTGTVLIDQEQARS